MSLSFSGVVLKLPEVGLCCRKYMKNAFHHTSFYIYDSRVLVIAAYLNVLKEGERQNKVTAFVFY